MASNRGPAAIGGGLPTTSKYHKEQDTGFNSWNNNNPSAGGGGATLATADVPGGSTSSHTGTTTGPAAGPSDESYEKNLVLELCPPSGVKPVPPPHKLAAFACLVSNLNLELICPVFLDFLEDGQPWVIHAKALCVMETATFLEDEEREPS